MPDQHPTALRFSAESQASPIEAGFGLVHAATLVATTADQLQFTPPGRCTLTVEGRSTNGPIAALGLAPGSYSATLNIRQGDDILTKPMRLLLIEPSQVCRRFGARYGSLEYDMPVVTGKGTTAPWESLWKTGEFADIVVDFAAPYKFILWRGMAYAPSWAQDNVMTSLFFGETVEPGVYRDCCEMMSDRECRYSHARVIHSGPARVVIHWRYALADSAYTINRNQWADELYFIYPDGVAVRNVTLHLDPKEPLVWQEEPGTGRRIPCQMLNSPPGRRTYNDMEFITVNAAGATSDDNMPLEALSLLDGGDFSRTFRWPHPPNLAKEGLPPLAEYIFRLNYRHRPGVFVASPAAGVRASLQGNVGMHYEAGARVQDDRWTSIPDLQTNFADMIHWPVTRGYGTLSLTDPAHYHDRPTHTFLGHASNAPVEVAPDGAATWSWLTGMVPDDEGLLRSRVRAWTAPATIRGARYDVKQAAYVVEKASAGAERVDLAMEAGHTVVRPRLVLPGWGGQVRVLVDNLPLEGDALAVSVERSLYGVQAVVTLLHDLPTGSTLQIQKVE